MDSLVDSIGLARPHGPAAQAGASVAAAAGLGMTKAFALPHERHTTVRERVVHPLRTRSFTRLQALRNVSFDVRPGEFFGIVGKNGSGKSTLLKCLAGIYSLDQGSVLVRGRLAPFIELGVGFTPEMTGRENAIASAVMLGLTPAQARERLPAMIAFAELEDFVDMKLKNYSSGMSARLAFAVSVQVDADVLLFDEVLAVGDASFERKCLAQFDDLQGQGRTILLVTHDMTAVKRHCDRAMLLHEGEVLDIDTPAVVARGYETANRGAPLRAARPRSSAGAPPHLLPEASGVPSPAFRGGLWRLLTLTRSLASAQFKLRYLDSTLSYFWAVARPLIFFVLLYGFVTQIAHLDRGIHHFPVYLLTALVLWGVFDQSTAVGLHCLVSQADLLRRLPIPQAALPLSVVLTALLDLAMNMIAVLALLLITGVPPGVGWLELPLLIGLLAIVTAGMTMLLSVLYVRYRDLDQIWLLATQALFFGTPIFYTVTTLPRSVQRYFLLNPLAALFTEMRHALIDPNAPSAAEVLGGGARLLLPLGVAAAITASSVWVFRRQSRRVAENL